MRWLSLVLCVFEGNEDGDDDDGVDESGDVHLVLKQERGELVDGVVGDEVECRVGLGCEGLSDSARRFESVDGGGVHDVEGLRRREREVVEERLAEVIREEWAHGGVVGGEASSREHGARRAGGDVGPHGREDAVGEEEELREHGFGCFCFEAE